MCGGAWTWDPLAVIVAHDEARVKHLGEDALGLAAHLWLLLELGVLLLEPVDGGQFLLELPRLLRGSIVVVDDFLLIAATLRADLHELATDAFVLYSQEDE